MKLKPNLCSVLLGVLLLILATACTDSSKKIKEGEKSAYVVMDESGNLRFTSFVVTDDETTYTGKWEVLVDDPKYGRYMENLEGLKPDEKRMVEPWNW